MNVAHESAAALGVAMACGVLGVARASCYRALTPAKPMVALAASPRALSAGERQQVLDVLHEPRFVDMTYTAFSAKGPRIALAVSKDLIHWERRGLATFAPYRDVAFENIDDKDASLFPAIPNPSGVPHLAMLLRPLFPGTRPEETACQGASREVDIDRESIWNSYCSLIEDVRHDERLGRFTSHHRLATPVAPWE